MKIILIYLYNLFYIFTGCIISSIIFKIIQKNSIKQYKKKCIAYEKELCIINQNFENESNTKKNIEEKLHNELQLTYKLNGKLAAAEERLKLSNHYQKKCDLLNHELNIQINLNRAHELKLKELTILLNTCQSSIVEKQKLFLENESNLKIQFENLTNHILELHGHKFNQQNQTTLNNILNPFQEQLKNFQNQIQNHFSQEIQIQNNLTHEIRNLHQLNIKITQETVNLTQALKGNNKIQGNWGEIILTRALEESGLRNGHEFHIQKNIKKNDGKTLQPDVIIHLPHGKEVIIDAKVSLLSYERYFNSNNEQEKKIAISNHIRSLRSHIMSLNKKEYHTLSELHTLDYVLMFIPIESALILAIEKESSLLTDAAKHNIMLVSPTTLFIALRTINNLWRYEHQNQHAQKISEKAGRLYDKLKLFMDDLNKIGQYLKKAEITYNAAKNKFSEGKGNIISRAEGFRNLGVQIKQPIKTNNTIDTTNTMLLTDTITNNNPKTPSNITKNINI